MMSRLSSCFFCFFFMFEVVGSLLYFEASGRPQTTPPHPGCQNLLQSAIRASISYNSCSLIYIVSFNILSANTNHHDMHVHNCRIIPVSVKTGRRMCPLLFQCIDICTFSKFVVSKPTLAYTDDNLAIIAPSPDPVRTRLQGSKL